MTQVYLQTQSTYRSKLKNVYLLSDKTIPERLRTKLNLPDNDEGIDLVCETYSGEYWSVQCKYKSDQSAALTYKELSTFNSLSFNACTGISLGLVAHTSTKPVKKSHLMPMVNEIGLEKWLEISDADWKQITSVCRSNTLKPPKKRKPRRYQKAAIADAHKHFVTKNQKRGKLIMPCGTGKSLTACWIAQALEAKTIVVAVPSLALVRQSLADWTAEYLAEGVTPEWLAVCSDHSVGSMGDADSTVATAYEMGIPTNPSDEELDNFLKKRSKVPKVVFTTYQSAEKLCDASRRNNKTFDLLIADEAHKTVGRKSKSFATLLFDENIKVKRRLFMTATERVYNASRDNVISMDDPDIYGSTCHQLSFKEAIKQKIICDYKIVTIAVSDAEINALIQEKAELSVSAGNKTIETDAQSLAAGIAMQKAFKKYGIKHAVTFHNSIKRADNFKSQQEDLPGNTHIAYSHISSKLSAGERAKLLKGFAEEDRSLITNARCLTEGVDIKAIDCIAFVDPKQSTVDIVQAAGRAMRLSPETSKTVSYVVVPVIRKTAEKLEDFAKSERFREVISVISALSTQDERVVEELRRQYESKESNAREFNSESDNDGTLLFELDFLKAAASLKTVTWVKIGRQNWLNFSEARSHVRKLGLQSQADWWNFVKAGRLRPDIPIRPDYVYRNQGWQNFGDWLGTFRKRTQDREFLPYDEAKAFVQKLGLRNWQEWNKWSAGGERPENIPSNPKIFYGEVFDIYDWLGSSSKRVQRRDASVIWDYDALRALLKENGVTSHGQYIEFRQKNAELHLPTQLKPYFRTQWQGAAHFFSLERNPAGMVTFEVAREYARKLRLNSSSDWKEKTKQIDFPSNIPFDPYSSYKNSGWKNWNDFLDTGQNGRHPLHLDASLEEMSKAAKQLGINSATDWVKYSKSRDFPNHFPKNPASRKEWVSWKIFLGTPKDKTLAEVMAYAQSKGFKTRSEWFQHARSGDFPSDMPKAPNNKFAHQGWPGWNLFLGHSGAASYRESRKYARSLGLKSSLQWRDYVTGRELPQGIPKKPSEYYRTEGWVSWSDFLGYKTVDLLPYDEARNYVLTLKLNSDKEWYQHFKTAQLPSGIPRNAQQVYKNKGWVSWPHFLGKPSIKSYEDAQKYAAGLALQSVKDWLSQDLPGGIPKRPDTVYKDKGWVSWIHFLGLPEPPAFVSYEDAQKYAVSLALKSVKEWRIQSLPNEIPRRPEKVYKDKGWISWSHFLGKKD